MKDGRSGLLQRLDQFGELIGLVSGLFNEDRLLLLTAFRRAEEAREATVLASTTIWGRRRGRR